MIRSAQELVDALQNAQEATTPGEKEVAAARLVKAEREHYKKLGLEPTGNFFTRVVIPLLLVLVITITLALVVKFSYDASSTAMEAKNLAQTLHLVQRATAIAEHENCERANDSRQVNISNLRSDVHTLKTTLALWEAAIATSGTGNATPEVLAAFNSYLEGLRDGIHHKEKTIRRSIAAQRMVAIKPGSPIVDCEAVAPLRGVPVSPPVKGH